MNLKRGGNQDNQVVADVSPSAILQFADDAALQVVLGAGDPGNVAHGEVCQMIEVHIGVVKDNDFTRVNIGAKLAHPTAVIFGGGVHDGAAEQEGLKVESDVTLRGCFAAAMFGSVQGTGHHLDGGGMHNTNEPFEAEARKSLNSFR